MPLFLRYNRLFPLLLRMTPGYALRHPQEQPMFMHFLLEHMIRG